MVDKGKEAFEKALKNSRGAGLGVGLLGAAVLSGYAAYNSMFTGILFSNFLITCIRLHFS